MRRSARTSIDPAWNDFWNFVRDVVAAPSATHRLYRNDTRKPWGPRNVEWRELVTGITQKGRDEKNAYMRAYNARSPHVVKRHHLRAHYGVTLEWYDAKFREQGGVCAICCQPETMKVRRDGEAVSLAVDHHHGTDTPRGLLCHMCNRALGMFGDDLARLRAAIAYLESHATN